MAAPAYSDAVSTDGSSTAPAVTLPTGLQDGDLGLMQVVCDGSATFTPPADWLPVPRCGGTAGLSGTVTDTTYAFYYYKVLTAVESDDVITATLGTSRAWVMTVSIYTGVNQSVPFGGARSASAYSNPYSCPGVYNGYGDALAVQLISANFRLQVDGEALSGTTTNWTKQLAYERAAQHLTNIIVTNSASVASASASAQATGLTYYTGLDTHVTGVSLSLNSADTDFTIPKLSAKTTDISGTSAGGGGATASLDLSSDYFVVPGLLLTGITAFGASAAYTVTATMDGGSDLVVRTDNDADMGRTTALWSIQLAANDLEKSTGANLLITWSTSGRVCFAGTLLGALPGAAVIQHGLTQSGSSTTTPDAAALASDVDANSSMLWMYFTSGSNNVVGTLSGYAQDADVQESAAGLIRAGVFVNEGALTPATDKNPPAGASFGNVKWGMYAVEVGGGEDPAAQGATPSFASIALTVGVCA